MRSQDPVVHIGMWGGDPNRDVTVEIADLHEQKPQRRVSDEPTRTRAPPGHDEAHEQVQHTIDADARNGDHGNRQILSGSHRGVVVDVFVHLVQEQNVADAGVAPDDWPRARLDAQDPRGEGVAVFMGKKGQVIGNEDD